MSASRAANRDVAVRELQLQLTATDTSPSMKRQSPHATYRADQGPCLQRQLLKFMNYQLSDVIKHDDWLEGAHRRSQCFKFRRSFPRKKERENR